MLVISGPVGHLCLRDVPMSFNLAIEMLVISGETKLAAAIKKQESFNLAIEMLVISGKVLRGRPRWTG